MDKKDFLILLGNILDKFDTSLYNFIAPLLGSLFFPEYDFVIQLIFMYSTSITSLFARPCGIFFFGIFARYCGPLHALFYSLMGVGIFTIFIGCIPGYKTIGLLAPLSLVIIRLLRGICAAGQSSVAKLYIMHNKSDGNALRASYWYQSSSMMGIVISSSLSTVIIGTYPWMWRGCFVLAGITVLIALYVSKSIDKMIESKTVLYDGYAYNGMAILWHKKGNVIRVALVTIFSHITYSVPFIFMNTFVPLVTDISLSTMMKYNTTLLILDMIAVPIIGYCIERFNPTRLMVSASGILSCTIIPLFYFLPGASFGYVLFMRTWIVLWGVVFLCPLNFWCKKLFESSESYFLVGMGNGLGTAVLGHITTPVCLWIWYVTGCAYAPAIYLAFIMCLTLCAVISAHKIEEKQFFL